MKAVLIALAAFIVFDAVAWSGAYRTAAFRFGSHVAGLDWSWG